VNEPNHCKNFTEELSDFLFEKSAVCIALENFEIISCFNAPSNGYSVHETSVILKYHIKAFLHFSVRGEYCHGHFGSDAKIAD
jgi:hypothetical protein